MALANLSIYYTWKNVKSKYSNNKFKISAPTWNDIFDLPDGSYSFSFKITLILSSKNMKLWLKIHLFKFMWTRLKTELKTRCKLESLTPVAMTLLGSTKKEVDEDKDGENVPKLESVEVVLVHSNLVKTDYQQTSKVLFTFVPN